MELNDVQNAVKKLVSSYMAYTATKSDACIVTLQRQLDALNDLSPIASELHIFSSRNLPITDAISNMITLLNDVDSKCSTTQKVLTLFQKWVIIPALHEMLKTTFQLASTLATFLVSRSSENGNHSVVMQCLDLLKTLTYGTRVNYTEVFLDDFLTFLIRHVRADPISELTLPCLVIVANMTRSSVVVQQFIRNMEEIKKLYRCLINMLRYPDNDMLQVAALSTFVNLGLSEEVGSRLFHSTNLIRTLELVFNKTVNKDPDVQCFAVDIFIKLLTQERIHQAVLQYQYLNHCLTKIICLLDKQSSGQTVCKIYELFLTFASVGALGRNVNKAVEEATSSSVHCSPVEVALHWFNKPPENLWSPSIYAAKFIAHIIENSSDSDEPPIHGHIEDIIKSITSAVTYCCVSDNDVKIHCEKLAASLNLLLSICHNENYVSTVVPVIGADMCSETIEYLVSNFNATASTAQHILSIDTKFILVDAALCILGIMMAIKSVTNGIQDILYTHLQDVRLIPMLAFALTSNDSRERIHKSMQLVFLGSRLPDFPVMCLAEAVLKLNQLDGEHHQYESTAMVGHHFEHGREPDNDVLDPKFVHPVAGVGDMDPSVSSLIDRFQCGLSVKDMKPSEIMEMYELKIRSLEMKEVHLSGLLEANKNASKHSERLLAEYRSRWARSDAEALQLRSLLRESERRSEAAKEELTTTLQEKQQMNRDLQMVTEMVNELELKNNEHKRNTAELNGKIRSLQKNINEMARETKMLSETNVVVQESRDSFKAKAEELGEELSRIECDKRNIAKQLKESEAKVKDLIKASRHLQAENEKHNENSGKLKQENDKLNNEMDALKKSCEENKLLIDDVQSKYESCKQDLEKHKQITAMIYNISAGTVHQ